MGKSIRLCRLSLLDLGRQGIQVDEQKPCQLMHLSAELFVGLVISVNCLIAIQAELVSPLLKGRSDPVFRRKLIYPFLKFPSFDFWGKAFQGQFHSPSVTGTCGRVQTRLASMCGVLKSSSNMGWQMIRHFNCFWSRQDSNDDCYCATIWPAQISWKILWVMRPCPINDCTYWPGTSWALKKDIPKIFSNWVGPRSYCCKPEVFPVTVRAIVRKDSHEQLQS